ncbi:MAG: universal stress protein [Longimicrobiales bacterium]
MNAGTIILATRVGEESRRPARIAARLAGDLGVRLTILYIAVELETVPVIAAGAGLDEEALRSDMVQRADRLIRDFMKEVAPVEALDVVIAEGDPVEQIVTTAAELKARFLVVGGRERTSIARIILGDTTRSILQRSPCPVIVVPMSTDFAEG